MGAAAIFFAMLSVIVGQKAPSPPQNAPAADDAKKVEGLEKQVEGLLDAGKLSEALPLAREVESILVKAQGRENWHAVTAAWRVRTLTAVLARSPEEQAEYRSALSAAREGKVLSGQSKHAEAQPLYEKSLDLVKKLLGEEYPDTISGYSNAGLNLKAQGRFPQAQPLLERAYAISKKLLGEEHPDTVSS